MPDETESHSHAVESAGAALHAERNRQGLSIGDVSRQLKLSVRQVEALERDDFKMFGGAVFVHGFLRNYAKFLGLDAADLIVAADRRLALETAGTSLEVQRSKEVPLDESAADGQKGLLPLFLVAAVVAGGVAAWMLLQQPDAQRDDELADGMEASQFDDEAFVADRTGNDTALLTEPGADVMPEPRQGVDAPVAADGMSADQARRLAPVKQARLQLGFRDESWVEVSDRYGEVIFAELVPRGVARAISGAAPLTVVIGNASGVDLVYDGKPINLSLHTRVDVARLTLE